MKKFFSYVLIILLGLFLVSCGNKNTQQETDGRYAIYKLASENDFNGTYEEWLESIKGDKVILSVIDDELKWKYSQEADSSYRTLVKLSTLRGKDGSDGKDAKVIKDITTIKYEDKTIFTFIFDDNSEIKAELINEKVTTREVKSITKEINAYKIFKYQSDSKYYDIHLDKEEFQLGKFNFKFIENEDLVPYISLEEMVKIYNTNLSNTNYISTVEEIDGNSLWTIKNNNTITGTIKVDPKNQEIVIDGIFENVFKGAIDYSKYSLLFDSKYTVTAASKAQNKMILSFKDTEYITFKENGINYYPFGLLNMALQGYSGHKYFYNYINLYEYNEFEQLNQMEIYNKESDEDSFMVMDQMKNYIDSKYTEKDVSGNPLMPLYLRKNHRSEFTFMFENYYGLGTTRNIKSMKTYFENYGIYDDMISDNSLIRGKAYSNAAYILEDLHTGKYNTSTTPWGEDNGGKDIEGAHVSKLVDERRTLGRNLSNMRKEVLKNKGIEEDNYKKTILYSEDGLTAYFYFDGFDASTNAYKKVDGNYVRKDDDKLAEEDSYFFFVKQLNEIKAHTTMVGGQEVKVKNVIIDDSQNGGGYVYILGKLLALISKDNKGITYTQNDITKEITKSVYQVDSNKDGKYDELDCYGNYFDFYIITSSQSFSCGNAFPIIASYYKYAKIIGERSGGGECVVDQGLVSNGICYAHSGNEHLIIYDEDKNIVSGVEDGIAPDSVINYYEFYDIEALNKVIKKLSASS